MADRHPHRDAADGFGDATHRDRDDECVAGCRRGIGQSVRHQTRACAGEGIGEGVKGCVQVDGQWAFKTACCVAKNDGALVLAARQVGGRGFERDVDPGRGPRCKCAGGRADGEPRDIGRRAPVERGGTRVRERVAATAGGEGTALGAGGDQAGAADAQAVWSGCRAERGLGHDNADPGVTVDAGRFDVERTRVEQGADFGGAESRVVGLQQTGDGRCVRGRGRGAEETGEAGHRGGDAVGGGQVGFGEQQAAAGREVAGREGRAVRLEKHPAGAVAAEGLDCVAGGERRGGACSHGGPDRGDTEGIGGAGSIVAAGLTGGAQTQPAPARAEVQVAIGGPRLLHHDNAFTGVEGVDRFIRVLTAGLEIGRTAQHTGAGAIENKQVVVVGGGAVGV